MHTAFKGVAESPMFLALFCRVQSIEDVFDDLVM